MSKKISFIIASALLLSSTSAFADTIPNRPANATGTAPGVDAKVHMIQPGKGGVEGVTTALYCPKTDCIECPRIDG